MSCISQTLAGLIQDCENNMGGIKKVWISTINTKPILINNIISDFELKNNENWYEYNFKKNTGSFTQTLNTDPINSINFVTTELILQFTKMDIAKRLEMSALAVNDMYIIIQDANNKYWYMGYDEAVTANAGISLSGTAKTDGNFYQITLSADSKTWLYEIKTDIAQWITYLGNQPLRFLSKENNNVISINENNTFDYNLYSTTDFKHYDKIDKNWSKTLNEGDNLYIIGNNPDALNKSNKNYVNFIINSLTESYGNIMSLLGENITEMNNYCFMFLFKNCNGLLSAPKLPALNIPDFAYSALFQNCENLINAPIIEGITVGKNSCQLMFSECHNLIYVPDFKAITLNTSSYANMFLNCYNLENAPYLPAINLPGRCYNGLFKGCSKINKIELEAETYTIETEYNNSFTGWLNETSSTGIIIKKQILNLLDTNIPSGWSVINK